MIDQQLLSERLNAFNPEPLIDDFELDENVEIPMVEEDENNIDLAKVNYLDVLNNEEIKQASEAIIRKYGVGTCGPRAFYGTTDVHLELEERLAEFFDVELSIVYSYGFVAISSSIAAYCKRSDVVFVDEHANFPIMQGLIASKSRVVRYKHQDADDFRRVIDDVDAQEKRNKGKRTRKFLIAEGISWETGKLCPLPEFLKVAEQHKCRVFLEESYSVGVFGDTGRGLTEHFGIDRSRVDMIFGTLEGALGSIGGFCAGSNLCIEHQSLNGAGYIFSASLPTYLVKVVLKSIELMSDKPSRLRPLSIAFNHFLTNRCGFHVTSDPGAPFQLFSTGDSARDDVIHARCRDAGVHFIRRPNGGQLQVNLNVALTEDGGKEKLERVYKVLEEAAQFTK